MNITNMAQANTNIKPVRLGDNLAGQTPETSAPSSQNPKDMFYSDGINTPLEVAFLPFADFKVNNDILSLSRAKDDKLQLRYQGELTNKNNSDNYEIIDYKMQSDKNGNVLMEGRYGATEFKEEFSLDGAFSAKLKHYEKDKATGEYVENGGATFRDLPLSNLGDYRFKGNVAGIPVEEKMKKDFTLESAGRYINGKIGELDINTKSNFKNASTHDEEFSGNIGKINISGDETGYGENYVIIDRNLGDFRLKMKKSLIELPQTEQPNNK